MIKKLILTAVFASASTVAFAHPGHTEIVAGHSHFVGEYMFELALIVAALGAVTLAVLKK